MLGIALAITAAFFWGATAIFVRLGLREIKTSTGTFLSMISSVVLVGFLALIINFDAIASLSLEAILWFGLIGLINFFLGRQLNYIAIRYVGVVKATPIFSSAPLFAMILAVTLTGEKINVLIIIGTVSIIAGLYMIITGK